MVMQQQVHVPISNGYRMRCWLALPEGADSAPALIVLHEAYGMTPDIKSIAARFAENGYVALAPDLNDRARPRLLCITRTLRSMLTRKGDVFDDLDLACAWLAELPEVDGSRLGAVGFCMGGGFATLFAVRAPLQAVANFYSAVPDRQEELEGICPLLGGFGERDSGIAKQARRLEEDLTAMDVPHDIHIHPDAGYSFMNQNAGLLPRLFAAGPMTMGYNADAAEDPWKRMFAFFGEHLSQASPA